MNKVEGAEKETFNQEMGNLFKKKTKTLHVLIKIFADVLG